MGVGLFFFLLQEEFLSPLPLFISSIEYPLSHKRPSFHKNLDTNRWASAVKRTFLSEGPKLVTTFSKEINLF